MGCTCNPPGSCGFHRGATEQPYPRLTWTEAQLRAAWGSWSREERQIYLEILEAHKPNESEPLEAARLAAGAVLLHRRRRAWSLVKARIDYLKLRRRD